MSKNVFANGMEISAKKDDNKSICAMPDVCLSPPSPPAGPVPIPYPNTAMASDTSNGSKTVKIGGGEVGLKNSSNYKKSTGDEAATKSLGMGVVTHTIQGKMQHAAWSFDVKIEGKNVIRHMDLTTHNHMNTQNSGSMTLDQAKQQLALVGDLTCEELDERNETARTELNKLPPAHAVTISVRQPAEGPPRLMQACSNQESTKKLDGWQPTVKDKKQPECAGGRGTSSGRRYDSENKTLHPEMKAGEGGSIKMSTFHTNGSRKDAMPCRSCRQAICEAEQCGIQVWLCKATGKPPEAVRPHEKGLCPPAKGPPADDEWDPAWADEGLGVLP
jgi:hypothetical protein